MKKITLTTIIVLPFLFSCNTPLPSMKESLAFMNITPYTSDINQGTILERDKVNQLQIGMTKEQVQNLLGSPSIIDPFHNNQWHYVNYSILYKKDNIDYRLILTFKDATLAHINDDGMDTLPPVKALEASSKEKTQP